MQHDPLAQYRRKSPPPGYEPPRNEPDKYAAFDTEDKVFWLRIRGADDSIHPPGYNILLNLLYDKQGTSTDCAARVCRVKRSCGWSIIRRN
jgi:hypothetical protein